MSLLLKAVHVVDPAAGRNGIFDMLIEGERIAAIDRRAFRPTARTSSSCPRRLS